MFVEHLGLMNYFIKDNALQMSLFTLNHLVFAFPHGLSLLSAPMQIRYELFIRSIEHLKLENHLETYSLYY